MTEIKTRKVLDQITPYALGQTLEQIKETYQLDKVIKMSDNESVYGCSPHVEKTLSNELQSLFLYPNGIPEKLIKKLSTLYNVHPDHFIIGNGSEEIIRLLARAYISRDDEAIMADITFPRYETNVLLEGGKTVKVPLKHGVHDLTRMYEAISSMTKMIFICNPNNPTGTVVDQTELLEFIEKIPSHILIVLDEAYYEYVKSDPLQSVTLLNERKNLIILRTFSKIYGLAALRVGYGMMQPSVVEALHKVKDVFNVNQLAQIAATAAITDQTFIDHVTEKNRIEVEFMMDQLIGAGIHCYPSETNFVFAYSNHLLVERLLRRGIMVRKIPLQGYEEAFRVTVGTREENEVFIQAVKQLLNEKVVQ